MINFIIIKPISTIPQQTPILLTRFNILFSLSKNNLALSEGPGAQKEN